MAIDLNHETLVKLSEVIFGLAEQGMGDIENVDLPGYDGDCRIVLRDGADRETDCIFAADWVSGGNELTIKRYMPYGVIVQYWKSGGIHGGHDLVTGRESFIPYSSIAYIQGKRTPHVPDDVAGAK